MSYIKIERLYMRPLFRHSAATAALLTLLMACSPQVENAKVAAKAETQPVTKPKASAPAAVTAEGDNTPCTEVFLTGTGGGPAAVNGNAQSGVFIRSGHSGNGCNDVRLQFDAGRGTLLKLSLVPSPTRPGFVTPPSISALFITHGHSDHTSSIPDILETRWIMTKNDGQFPGLKPPKPRYKDLPVICFEEACDIAEKALVPWEGEIEGRTKKDHRLVKPKADVKKYTATTTPQIVWESAGVTVSAVRVDHIEGAVGYKIETAAGEVCISGDTSFSNDFKLMCEESDLMIHEVIHPVLDGIAASLPNPDPTFTKVMDNIFNSHTSTDSFDKLEGTNAVVVLTHIIPPIGAGGFQGIPLIPRLNKIDPARGKGPTKAQDFCTAIQKAGFTGELHVGLDLMQIKLSDGKLTTKMPDGQQTDCATF